MHRSIILLLIILTPNFAPAQQAGSAEPTATSLDHAAMAAAIRGSYYHPDEMSTLSCNVSADLTALFASMKLNVPAERLKAIQGLNIRSQSVRGKSPVLAFKWTAGDLNDKEKLEDGLRQMLDGFDQIYWSLIASPPIDGAAEITKIEPHANGGAEVYSSSPNAKVVISVDKENIPTHYVLDIPGMNGTVDVGYTPSANPVPGDLRRITTLTTSERMGTSIINLKLDLDYQVVNGFYVPKHVMYDLGTYSLSMQLSDCSASTSLQRKTK